MREHKQFYNYTGLLVKANSTYNLMTQIYVHKFCHRSPTVHFQQKTAKVCSNPIAIVHFKRFCDQDILCPREGKVQRMHAYKFDKPVFDALALTLAQKFRQTT